ncbi:helix-turn-helix domain-containing protein [Gordonia sp. FQ]|uniref:AraC family transcriptional regulator n=1 Tax=Gordonia sp. FQ TaxID=3446634 RepID=UPI003F82AB67
MTPDDPAQGLDRRTVAAWRARIGAGEDLGDDSTRYLLRRGRSGLDDYLRTFTVTADSASGFAEYLYWRPLTQLLTFSLLRTPCATVRTPERVREYRSDFVLVGTQTLPGGGVVEAGGRRYHYDHPRHLVVIHNDEPFRQESFTTADLAGIWVPTDLLGRRSGQDWSMVPLVDSSPLARATAAFVTRFANDVAARRASIDIDGEHAVAELVRAALSQHRDDSFRAVDSDLYLREITRSLIDQNYRDPEFSPDSIARMLYVSSRHMYRYFAGAEESPTTLIARRRLAHARELLACHPRMSLGEVAADSGFASPGTFTKRFRTEYGMTPSAYRKAVQAGEIDSEPSRPESGDPDD